MPRARHGSILALICVALVAACGGGHRVSMTVEPRVSLWDAPVQVTIAGLAPHARVTVHADGGRAGLVANGSGRVDVLGRASLRLLWSLEPGPGRLTLTVPGARATIVRLARAPGVREVDVRSPFYGDFFARPRTSVKRPGILLFGGSEGGLRTTELAELYASHGYPTLDLAYFAEPGLPRNLVRIPIEYFATALRWLALQPGVDPQRLAVEGISRGSEAAQLVGILYPSLVHAVMAMVPGNGSSCGIHRFTGSNRVACLGPAWTFRGRPIPYSLREPNTPYPFADERIDGPILLDCGGHDELWRSCPMARSIVGRLLTHHFRHAVTLLYYPRGGHGIGPLLPLPGEPSDLEGFAPESNVIADANGWPRLLRFLHRFADS
jgi:hypothetical protein